MGDLLPLSMVSARSCLRALVLRFLFGPLPASTLTSLFFAASANLREPSPFAVQGFRSRNSDPCRLPLILTLDPVPGRFFLLVFPFVPLRFFALEPIPESGFI
jgi:hypothetical protein